LDHAFYERAVELLVAELGDELVALDQNAGNCFGFNGVATSVWRLLEQPRTFEALKASLLDEYDVEPEQCARELRGLLDEMISDGLVRESRGSGPV
jgi:hypothetical protein